MNQSIRIQLSGGLVAVAIIHAVCLAGLFVVMHEVPSVAIEAQRDDQLQLPVHEPRRPAVYGEIGEFYTPRTADLPPINTTARDEIKQQQLPTATDCVDCRLQAEQVARSYNAKLAVYNQGIYALLTDGRLWRQTGKPQTLMYSGSDQRTIYGSLIAAMQQGVVSQTPQQPNTVPNVQPQRTPMPMTSTKAKYQLALFLTNDSKSQSLEQWFKTNRELLNLSRNCDFQVYRPDNPLYRTRYARDVPVDQFPAVLFLKPDGGHIHAAGKSMIPSTADELVRDIKLGIDLSKSVESQNSMTGMIRESGYSWDASITPTMTLEAQDNCLPGMPCYDDPPEDGGGFLDRFRDKVNDKKEAVVWAGLQEIVAVILAGFAALLVVILILILALKSR